MLSMTLRFIIQNHIIGQNVGGGAGMEQMLICSNCRTQNSIGQRFCIGCGMPLTISCPNCGADMPPTSKFCTNCGVQFILSTQQPVKERKGKSGWAIFGMILLTTGILCLVSIPVILLTSSGDIEGILWIRATIVGIFNISVGLSLMRKG